jgi:hypothetical protein
MAVLSHAFSGKHGTAKAAPTGGTPAAFYEVTGWKIDPKIEAPKHCSNLTLGMKVPIYGVSEWAGSIEVMLQDPGAIPFNCGYYDIELHVDDSTQNYFSGTVLITGGALDCQISDGKEVTVSFPFEGASALTPHGILTLTGGSGSSPEQ